MKVRVFERQSMVDSDGVLLYYKYAPIPDVPALVRFYESNFKSLGLLGRVRVAPDGVNVTVGGKISALEKHIEVMRCDALLVTLRSDPLLKSPDITFLLPSSILFCKMLLVLVAGKSSGSQELVQQQQLVLLDARNLYETRMGKFQNPNVETLDPELRQYSDLPAWIDEHSAQLHGKQVLMYCTGGIRCEMASAYIRSKGAGYKNVFRLYGGIQRYLEQFPDGGFFKGKNFVFDHSQDAGVVGACLTCGTSFDDYSSRCRCTYCRMLVLVCYNCQNKNKTVAKYVCELCKKHRKQGRQLLSKKDDQFHSSDSLDTPGVESGHTAVCVAPCSIISGTNG